MSRPRIHSGGAGDPLSEEQRLILQYLSNGYTYIDVGNFMDIQWYTAREYTKYTRIKLEASTTVQAVAIALRDGLIH